MDSFSISKLLACSELMLKDASVTGLLNALKSEESKRLTGSLLISRLCTVGLAATDLIADQFSFFGLLSSRVDVSASANSARSGASDVVDEFLHEAMANDTIAQTKKRFKFNCTLIQIFMATTNAIVKAFCDKSDA